MLSSSSSEEEESTKRRSEFEGRLVAATVPELKRPISSSFGSWSGGSIKSKRERERVLKGEKI